jgi:hypothetical protein
MKHNLQSAVIGARMRGTARAVAPFLVFAYVAGFTLGTWLHRSNDQLAAAYLRLLGLDRPPVKAAPAPKPAIRAAIHRAPLTVEGLCKAHTQRELMVMAGTRSKRSKKQLAERILSK